MRVPDGAELFADLITTRGGRQVLVFAVDADSPAYGNRYRSPLGEAQCVYSDGTKDPLDQIVARLIGIQDMPPPPDLAPPLYRPVVDWLNTRPRGWWVLSHRIDNDVLSIGEAVWFELPASGYLAALRDYQPVQTESRRLTFLDEGRSTLVDYTWDSETFAVFLHTVSDSDGHRRPSGTG